MELVENFVAEDFQKVSFQRNFYNSTVEEESIEEEIDITAEAEVSRVRRHHSGTANGPGISKKVNSLIIILH